MTEMFSHGRFEVEPGNEETFVAAWSEFAAWASEQPGAATLRLFRDVRNPGRFLAFGQWDGPESIRDWKSSPEFKERIGRVVKQAKEFDPTELVTLVRVTGGTAEPLTPPADIEPIHAPS
jgi:heme-degrading monooxygenase HmoA